MSIYELGHIYFAEEDIEIAKSYNRPFDNKFSDHYILGFFHFILKFVYSLFFTRFTFKKKPHNYDNVLVYGPSVNNKLSLMPIVEKYGTSKAVLLLDGKSLPFWRMYLYSMPHFFSLVREIKKSDKQKRIYFRVFFSKFWRMYGCERFAKECLSYYKPKLLIVANDHLEFNRALIKVAKQMNIKTMYVQHASVGSKFPPLEFDYSMLDGSDALDKYKGVGNIKGNVYLCGGVRFDKISKYNSQTTIKKGIGIAINTLDSEPIVKDFCLKLQSSNIDKVVLRPHPQMNSALWKQWCLENNIEFSDPANEHSFGFVSRLSAIIANQCSIHLDAAMCRTPSAIYNLSGKYIDDIYSFAKNGLCQELSGLEDVICWYKSNPVINKNAAKYYNYSFGSTYENRVAEMIADLIDYIVNNPESIVNFNNNYKFSCIESSSSYKLFST